MTMSLRDAVLNQMIIKHKNWESWAMRWDRQLLKLGDGVCVPYTKSKKR